MKRPMIFLSVFLFSCAAQTVENIKDMEQNMMDLKLYQENMGDLIKAHRLQEASWLLEGTDSILQALSVKFPKHRRLDRPFSDFYRKKMKEPLNDIREAIEANDTAKVLKSYRVLVKRCNGCHIDNDVDKEVFF
jgi:hypothetical protein